MSASSSSEIPTFDAIIEVLRRHGVEFIVIGGQAATLHGLGRPTYDTDLCYQRAPANLDCLFRALIELRARPRSAADAAYSLDAHSFALAAEHSFETDHGALDLHARVEPIGEFDQVRAVSDEAIYDGRPLLIIGLEALVEVKRYLKRPRDRGVLCELLAIQRELRTG